jgi:hypothetical protein
MGFHSIINFMADIITARGHPNVTSKHRTTLEITTETDIGPRADCIIGVSASKGMAELSEKFKERARDENCLIQVRLAAGGMEEKIVGHGHTDLILTHPTDIVIRKSDYICPRTLMVHADKAAVDLDKRLINLLKDKNQELVVEIEILEKKSHTSRSEVAGFEMSP